MSTVRSAAPRATLLHDFESETRIRVRHIISVAYQTDGVRRFFRMVKVRNCRALFGLEISYNPDARDYNQLMNNLTDRGITDGYLVEAATPSIHAFEDDGTPIIASDAAAFVPGGTTSEWFYAPTLDPGFFAMLKLWRTECVKRAYRICRLEARHASLKNALAVFPTPTSYAERVTVEIKEVEAEMQAERNNHPQVRLS